VEYNNDDQSSVTITVPGVQVRFNGKKAWIQLSKLYKEQQCGLCGHYNEDAEDELRMGNDESTTDLASFHRSYSVPNGEECTEAEQERFYAHGKQQGHFGVESAEFRRRADWPDSAERDYNGGGSGQQESEEEAEEDAGWWGADKRGKASRWPASSRGRSQQQANRQQRATEEPTERTAVTESSDKICFSMTPVKQCPEGTSPTNQQSSDGSSEQQRGGQQQGGQERKTRKVAFTCFERSDSEARRLQRQARNGVADTSGREASFTKQVPVPSKCIRY